MGAQPSECLVIEDSRYGVQAARAAGMRVLAFTGGLTPASQLTGPNTVLIPSMRELPRLLDMHRTSPSDPGKWLADPTST
jgi:beta-phosphoglucomutase-like phosphatase (HAD superfamily)